MRPSLALRVPALLGAFVAVVMLVPDSDAQSWARYRGPGGSGIRADAQLPRTFGEEHVVWRVPIVGVGHSSPVLWGSRIYLTREGPGDGARSVAAFDAEDGAEVWSRELEFQPHAKHSLNSHASSTPAVDGSGVYVSWTSKNSVQALALEPSGEVRWKRELGPHVSQHGGGNSPVLWGDLLVVANEHEADGSFITALDKTTGEVRWRLDRETAPERAAYAAPVLLEREGARPLLVFASTAHGLTAVDPQSGEVAWELDLELDQRCVGVPAIAGDALIVSAGSGGGGKECAIVRLPGDAPDAAPAVAHRPRRYLPYVPGHLALDGRFYLFSDGGIASCLEAKSGEPRWSERIEGTYFSSPVSDGETIWIASREGLLSSLAPGTEFGVLGTFDLGAPVLATPALGADFMIVRTADELVRLGAR